MELITDREPPPKRVGNCEGPFEQHLLEAAVMLAVSQWLFTRGAKEVTIRPDGMHVKKEFGFDINRWLEENGFEQIEHHGGTRHGGVYKGDTGTMKVEFKPGLGDVEAVVGDDRFLVETKGGCINTTHSGQCSKLRKHLYEAVGSLMANQNDNVRLIAAVPKTKETEKLAISMAQKCGMVGIEVALVSVDGNIRVV